MCGGLFLFCQKTRGLIFGSLAFLFFQAQPLGLGCFSLPRLLFHTTAHLGQAHGGLFGPSACSIGLASLTLSRFNARSFFFGPPSFSLFRALSPGLFDTLSLFLYEPQPRLFFKAFFLFHSAATFFLFGARTLLFGLSLLLLCAQPGGLSFLSLSLCFSLLPFLFGSLLFLKAQAFSFEALALLRLTALLFGATLLFFKPNSFRLCTTLLFFGATLLLFNASPLLLFDTSRFFCALSLFLFSAAVLFFCA
jgi:hypothetical protein